MAQYDYVLISSKYFLWTWIRQLSSYACIQYWECLVDVTTCMINTCPRDEKHLPTRSVIDKNCKYFLISTEKQLYLYLQFHWALKIQALARTWRWDHIFALSRFLSLYLKFHWALKIQARAHSQRTTKTLLLFVRIILLLTLYSQQDFTQQWKLFIDF